MPRKFGHNLSLKQPVYGFKSHLRIIRLIQTANSSNPETPDTSHRSETGTEITLGFGSYGVTEDKPNDPNLSGNHLSTKYSQDCSGVMHPDETDL